LRFVKECLLPYATHNCGLCHHPVSVCLSVFHICVFCRNE